MGLPMLPPLMLKLGTSLLPFALLAPLTFAACGSDDPVADGGTTIPDSGFDGGVTTDSGFDSGVPADSGMDAGPVDTGATITYCAQNDTRVTVDGQAVSIDRATAVAVNRTGEADLDCIDSPYPNASFQYEFCDSECLTFLGPAPTAQQVRALQFTVFDRFDGDRPVNAGFDPTTGQDHEPNFRVNVSARLTQVQASSCPSGWQVDIGFLDQGETYLLAEQEYVIRVRSSSVAAAWPTQYHVFIRRNDAVPANGLCDSLEARVPDRNNTFPLVTLPMLAEAIGEAGASVPGSNNLFDARGHGYLLTSIQDCNSRGGLVMEHATAGTLPLPIGDFYPEPDYSLESGRGTTSNGLYLAVGFTGMTATSSTPFDVRLAVGADRGNQCTEEFGGTHVQIYPDAITFLRANRETVLHDR